MYNENIMKKILFGLLLVIGTFSCDNSEEMPPRIEEITDSSITIPTTRLSYEEQDIIEKQRTEFEEVVARRAME